MRIPKLKELKHWTQDFRRDVIRMMRLKFVVMAMSILVAVFLVMLGSINMIMQTVSQSQSMQLLVQIAESDRYNSLEEDAGTIRQRPDSVPGGEGGNDILPLAWGGEDNRNDDRRPGMPGETNSDPDWNERRPPEWESDAERPSEDVPPPWVSESEQTEMPSDLPVQGELTSDPPERPVNDPPEMPSEALPPPESMPAETDAVIPETTETVASVVRESVPPPDSPQTPPEPREPRTDRWNVPVTIDHFAIMADAQGQFLGLRNTEDYSESEAEEILSGILAEDETQGMYGWLQFYRTEKPYGTLLVITDKTSDQGLLNNLYRTTVVIGILMLLVLLAVVIVLSRWITNPVHNAFVRQKQFVSDAGHELKTPIAVLTANADILQDEIGENKWLGYMQEQIGRMGQLVGDLLRLARMDNAALEYTFADFDLSMAVAATTLPFESAAFEQHRNLEMDIQPEVSYHGSEQHIRQLCAIFIDNAIKYSNENGVIKVTLLKRGEHSVLEFYNTGCEIAQEETEKIFERFYRGDKARKNQGKNGYGLGLAIAKSIMDMHRIRIQVTCEQGKWIRFLLTL